MINNKIIKKENRNKLRLFTLPSFLCIVLSIFTLLLTGCAKEADESNVAPSGSIRVFYLNNEETKLEAQDIPIEEDVEADIDLCLEMLSTLPNKTGVKSPIGSFGFEVVSYTVDGFKVTLDFSSKYLEMSKTTEVLVRAAIVKTLVSIDTVRYVAFTVDGNPLLDSNGMVIGKMSGKTFIYNDGNAINTYDEVVVKLYFANEDGSGIIGAYRDKFYSTNVPLELFVVEEMIAGPSGQIEGLYATINPETNVLNVSTSDGVCYVNLDSGFMNSVNDVSLELAAYSLVNSLTELPAVDKVQILVNGEVPAIFQTSTFEYNPDVVTTLPERSEENTEVESTEN